ncbi:MAG: ATP-binding cassette domain-containing protein [Candidatus Sumerlaeia bacterium]|nr:ATP-binding cassette domain-containing protein [Candidatus Sumerlaeia bacterium]
MIEVNNLTKEYRSGWRGTMRAVDDVTFTCHPGEVYGLLGPNGAGKTTLLRMVSTAIRPKAGTARLAGIDVCRQPDEARRNLGFLSGNTGLYDRLTARETLRYFGRLQGMDDPAIDARIDTLAAAFEMRDFLGRRCDKLSTGMKQKVNLARAVIHDPPVLVLDEPTNGLDVITIRAMTRFIQDAREQGRTVLLSTHQMPEVEMLCDRVGLLHEGKLRFDGTVGDLREASGGHLEEAFFKLVEARA